jgi:hypothetical protein
LIFDGLRLGRAHAVDGGLDGRILQQLCGDIARVLLCENRSGGKADNQERARSQSLHGGDYH